MAIQLTPEQVERLAENQAVIQVIYAEIEKAERAGIDVTDLRKRLDQVEKMRAGIMEVYGPNARRRRT